MNFFIIGDFGEYNEHSNKIMESIIKLKNENSSLILMGDNFYPQGILNENDISINKMRQKLLNIHMPVYAILGNHDYVLNPLAQINLKIDGIEWIMPSNYYKKSFDFIDIFFLDTMIIRPGYTSEGIYTNFTDKIPQLYNKSLEELKDEHIKWIDDELSKSKNKWKLVIGHYPLCSDGLYFKWNEIYNEIYPLLKKHNVDFYFCGHDHNMQIHFIDDLLQIVNGVASYNHKQQAFNSFFFYEHGGIIRLCVDKDKCNVEILDINGIIINKFNFIK
jgi:tartrate-resistant acid phosphatase type 5